MQTVSFVQITNVIKLYNYSLVKYSVETAAVGKINFQISLSFCEGGGKREPLLYRTPPCHLRKSVLQIKRTAEQDITRRIMGSAVSMSRKWRTD
jgi:hypothetical protein